MMAVGIGVGLPFGVMRRLPPQVSALSLWLDPRIGVTHSGGFVDSWASRVGTATFTGTTTTRPAYNAAGSVDFDGVDDFLTRTADAQSHPSSVATFTWAGWTYRMAAALAVVYSSVPLFTGSGGILVQDGASSHQYYANSAGSWNRAVATTAGTWVFQAIVYDSALALGSRLAVYEGTSPGAVALVAPTIDASVGNTGAAAASSDIGRDAGLGRFFGGRVASMYLYPSVKLTLQELQTLAAVQVPS